MRQNLESLRAHLASNAADIAVALMGAPTSRTAREMRWGRKESFALVIAGPSAGSWYDHEAAQGGDMFALIQRQEKNNFLQAVEWAQRWFGDGIEARPVPKPQPRAHTSEATDRIRAAARIWRAGTPPHGTPVEVYLKARGIALPEGVEDIRFAPECPRGEDRCPAMLALMRDIRSDQPRAIHRTFLTTDGQKAKRSENDNAKQMLGAVGGCAIKLSPNADVTTGLFITEGIENGLAALQGGWGPVWALGSAGAVQLFPVLPGIEYLSIVGDADNAGRNAAEACAKRWADAGRQVRIIMPRGEGADWNDVTRGAFNARAA